LGESLARDPNEVVPYKILGPVVDSVKQVVSSRCSMVNRSAPARSRALREPSSGCHRYREYVSILENARTESHAIVS
jgi:hypothetical protein